MECFQRLLPVFLSVFIHVVSCGSVDKSDLYNEQLPPCLSCRVLVNSFNAGLEKTARGKFEGGDSAWEQEKMKSYTKSEVRLIEIEERLCKDVERGKMQCHSLAEEMEPLFEEWWKNQETLGNLHKWLCIEKLQVCCPDLHYGKNCTPCDGYPDYVCNNNGRCKGSGTRKGNGKCFCNEGYEGSVCDKCSITHYEAYRDNNKVLCAPCHVSCQKSCTQAGPKGCHACKNGWIMKSEHGCSDINECAKKSACKRQQFCVNNEGSYSCLECDSACDTCYGDGPDMCKKCAEGYVLQDKICIDAEKMSRNFKINISRYLTYFGLCIATCIVFQRSTVVAALIGLGVAVYISLSEYLVATGRLNTDMNLNLSKLFRNV